MSKSDIPCQVLVRTIVKKPGLKETNFQVCLFVFVCFCTYCNFDAPRQSSSSESISLDIELRLVIQHLHC